MGNGPAMQTRGRIDREDARVTVRNATLVWTPLTERYPDTVNRVLVRMRDGRIGAGNWDGKKWHHMPFEPWGEPVAWASLPASYPP